MNKKLLLGLVILATASHTNGQIAKWLIPPMYDNIQMAEGEELIITDSINSRILWTYSGQRLTSTNDQLCPFSEGVSVTTKTGTEEITGFYNTKGLFTPIEKCYSTYSEPFFYDGYLLVHKDQYYRFVNQKGEMENVSYLSAYPFSNGYATCVAYKNFLKKKDPYNLMISKDNEQIAFRYADKDFDSDDIQFISSVNDENIGIIVANKKLYYFDGTDRHLSPVFARKEDTDKKRQAKLEYDFPMCFFRDVDSTAVLVAKSGKKDTVRIRFDQYMIPISITLADEAYTYKKNILQERTYVSPLVITDNGEKYGIDWDGDEMLPPQFDELISRFNDKAFVRLNGKCGMIQVLKDEDFKITINKDYPIGFRHQKYETTIRLDLPKVISSANTRIEIDPQTGCDVDMTSGDKKDTEFGNYIQYDCVLNIPQSLPDEMYDDSRNEIIIPTQVVYDGLRSPIISYKVKAWHYKYFNVDINESETSINKGTLSFTFNINAERNPGEAVYPTSVNIRTDSLVCELEKISETRYKCKVMDLAEGENNIVVQILEEGCPPASFPFEVTYTKPVPKTSKTSEVKEDVVIKKKTKKTSITPTPHLDI